MRPQEWYYIHSDRINQRTGFSVGLMINITNYSLISLLPPSNLDVHKMLIFIIFLNLRTLAPLAIVIICHFCINKNCDLLETLHVIEQLMTNDHQTII